MKIHWLFACVGGLLTCLLLQCLLLLPFRDQKQVETETNRNLSSVLMLTDLSLWTESRYTRHPSQADFFTSFQDFPGSLEHFPAGSIVVPPARHQLWRGNENELDKYVQAIENP